jgi:gamma-glutamyl phosphate reductase
MLDVREAQRSQLRGVDRLTITPARWDAMIHALRLIADSADPIGSVMMRREISPGLILQKETTPLGVLLAIFESRPDAIPQVAALAIKSGNGIIMKGGPEASNTNNLLHQSLLASITEATTELNTEVPKSLVPMIPTTEDVAVYLELQKEIDLVIPRGSYKLVQSIERNTRIPVLGHSEGVCHLYLHSDADVETAIRVIKDAKLDSPSSSNSVDTVLINKELLDVHAKGIVRELQEAGIQIHADKLVLELVAQRGIRLPPISTSFHFEYGDNRLSMVAVSSVDEAIDHINSYGSGHTDGIISQDPAVASYFGSYVDSACVFHNVSTRYADGVKFGLGVEVGTNTNRIHARGPVGVESLMTTKWRLTSMKKNGHIVADYVPPPEDPGMAVKLGSATAVAKL